MAENPFARDPAVQVGIGADTSGFGSAIDGAIGKLSNFKGAVAGVGLALGTLGAVGIAKSTQAFADFDESMQESIAVMGDVDEAMRNKLEQTAREVATTTTASHREAAESFYFLASAGLDAAESIEAMPEVAAFAEAGQVDMAQATDYATDVMSAFGYEASELNRVTDTLTATFTRHNQTAEGMGEAMSYVAPIAAGLGYEIEQVSTAIGLMGDAGIKGTRAGTSLRMALSRLANPPAQAQEVLDKLGVSVRDSSGEMRSMSAIIEDLNEAGADTADVMELFGVRAGPAMQVLLDQGGAALEEETQKISEMGGVTQRVAETQRNTFNKQLQITKSRLNDIGVSIGQNFMPPLARLLGLVNRGIDVFARFNERTNGMAGTVTLVATTLGGFAAAGAAAISMAGGLSAVLAALGAAFTVLTGPIGIAIAAIALLAGVWTANLFGIQEKTRAAFDWIVEKIQTALAFVRSNIVAPILGRIRELWSIHGEALQSEAMATWNHIWGTVKPKLDLLAQAIRAWIAIIEPIWTALWENFKATVSFAFDLILTVTTGWIDTVLSLFRAFMAVLRGDWKAAWDIIAGLADRQLDRIVSLFDGFKGLIIGLFKRTADGVIQVAKNLWKTLVGNSIFPDMLADILGAIRSWNPAAAFQGALGGALDVVKGIASDIKSRVDDALSTARSAASKAKSFASKAAERAKKAASKAASAARSAGSSLSGELSSTASRLGQRLGAVPGLDTGGDILKEGYAYLHAGERVLNPAEVDRSGGGSGGGDNYFEINVQAEDGTDAGRKIKRELRRFDV